MIRRRALRARRTGAPESGMPLPSPAIDPAASRGVDVEAGRDRALGLREQAATQLLAVNTERAGTGVER